MPLEKYYSGDEAFRSFASTPDEQLDAQLEAWSGKAELIALCGGDPLLARAVFYAVATQAIEWMSTAIPALDGRTPLDCLKSVSGQKRLKECLMRMP